MKKFLITISVLFLTCSTYAQAPESFDPLHDRQMYFDILNISAILGGMYLIASFIQQLIKQYYGYRIKNRMLDKGTDESVVRQMLLPEKKESRNSTLQWFCVLASIGAGLLLVSFIRPFGIHSLAILALSLAAGFGSYYYFTRQSAN